LAAAYPAVTPPVGIVGAFCVCPHAEITPSVPRTLAALQPPRLMNDAHRCSRVAARVAHGPSALPADDTLRDGYEGASTTSLWQRVQR
jgi:hypothetical protein